MKYHSISIGFRVQTQDEMDRWLFVFSARSPKGCVPLALHFNSPRRPSSIVWAFLTVHVLAEASGWKDFSNERQDNEILGVAHIYRFCSDA
jgi:hypothetical protein